jgi:hypothetical protein
MAYDQRLVNLSSRGRRTEPLLTELQRHLHRRHRHRRDMNIEVRVHTTNNRTHGFY